MKQQNYCSPIDYTRVWIAAAVAAGEDSEEVSENVKAIACEGTSFLEWNSTHLRLRNGRAWSLDQHPNNNVMSTTKRRSKELTEWTDARSNGSGLQNGSRLRSRFGAVGGAKSEGTDAMTPVLAHKLKHNKSILALAVSSDTLFAGTEGGEILVSTLASCCSTC